MLGWLSGTDPTKEFKPFKIQTDFDKSLEKFKHNSFGSAERKIYKRRQGICKNSFKEFLENFEKQITASNQVIQKLYEINLDKDISYKDDFFIADTKYSGRFGVVFLTTVNGDINLTYIQFDVVVPRNVPECQNIFQTSRCFEMDTKNQSAITTNEQEQEKTTNYLPSFKWTFQNPFKSCKSFAKGIQNYVFPPQSGNIVQVKGNSMQELPSEVESYVRMRFSEVLQEEGFVKGYDVVESVNSQCI